nr:TetR/AcrR family transcriptional regulator [Pseudoruegeria sp. HB172150]
MHYKEHHTATRIRDAAIKLFAEHGYAAVSMRQLAAEVGVQAGALYIYIPDKQTLLYDLMRDHLEELLAEWRAMPKGDDPLQRLEAFVRFHIDHMLARPDAVFVAYMELRNLAPQNYVAITALRGAYEHELERILRDGMQQNLMRVPDAKLTTKALLAMMTGVTGWCREGGRLSRERVERIYWKLARRAVGA